MIRPLNCPVYLCLLEEILSMSGFSRISDQLIFVSIVSAELAEDDLVKHSFQPLVSPTIPICI